MLFGPWTTRPMGLASPGNMDKGKPVLERERRSSLPDVDVLPEDPQVGWWLSKSIATIEDRFFSQRWLTQLLTLSCTIQNSAACTDWLNYCPRSASKLRSLFLKSPVSERVPTYHHTATGAPCTASCHPHCSQPMLWPNPSHWAPAVKFPVCKSMRLKKWSDFQQSSATQPV